MVKYNFGIRKCNGFFRGEKRRFFRGTMKKLKIICPLILFATALLAALLVLKIPQRLYSKIRIMTDKKVNVYEEKIHIEGMKKPVRIICVADTHIALCDERDESLLETQAKRYEEFTRFGLGPDKNMSLITRKIKKNKPDTVLYLGDIIDKATEESIDFIGKEFEKTGVPYMYLMGNHDFEYEGEYFSDTAYEVYLPKLAKVNGDSDGIEVKEFEEFTLLLLDDCNNNVPDKTSETLEELKAAGKPVIVALHVPIVPPDGQALIEETNAVWGSGDNGESRVLMGYGGKVPNGETAALIDFITADDSPVVGVIAGHVHFYSKHRVNPQAFQYTLPAGYERGMLELTVE